MQNKIFSTKMHACGFILTAVNIWVWIIVFALYHMAKGAEQSKETTNHTCDIAPWMQLPFVLVYM